MMSARNRVDHPATIGLVLAGGLARRMGGGDKALISIGGVPLLDRVVAVLRPACTTLVINANGDPVRFGTALPIIPDSVPGFTGPLAGVLAGLDWAVANTPDVDWVASVPTDCPFLPADLVVRLHAARAAANADLAVAASGGRSHPVIGLWPVRLRDGLRHALTIEGERKVGRFVARYRTVSVEWSAEPIDPFFNVNAPGDVAEAARVLACGVPASCQPFEPLTIHTTDSITGTSMSTPTTVASAAPDCDTNSEIAAVTVSSKKLEAPISAEGPATQWASPNARFKR